MTCTYANKSEKQPGGFVGRIFEENTIERL